MTSAAERQRLLELLLRDGVLHRSPTQQIFDLDGGSARWMLDSLGVSLTAGGARLAARALLRLLEQFEGRQLATYGTIGIPLLEAVILESKGKYRGVLVRKEVKTYGARRRIDGVLDPREPVIIIDDSISSGFSIERCAAHLREAGCEVEGAVCLVRFEYDAVSKVQRTLGFPVRTVFDVERDLAPHIPGERMRPKNGTKVFGPVRWAQKAPEGLTPCELARTVMAHWLRTGKLLKPPRRLDATYDARGGAFVSMRRRDDIHDRPARMGFWHFPEEERWSTPQGVVMAALQTAEQLVEKVKKPREVLDACSLAVTFFGPLESVSLGQLDNDRFGIVVRSTERVGIMGGALPKMPGIRTDWEQFRHAAFNNARLFEGEPYELLRHTLTKHVDGEAWQPTGVPLSAMPEVWEHSRANVEPFVHAARHITLDELGLDALQLARGRDRRDVEALVHQDLTVTRERVEQIEAAALRTLRGQGAGDLTLPPAEIAQVYLTLYIDGSLGGCVGAPLGGEHGLTLRELARAVVADARFGAPKPNSADQVGVSVSFLRAPLRIGEADAEWVSEAVRVGEQALLVSQADRSGLLLPLVAMRDDLTRVAFARATLDKAGLRAPPYTWTRFDCTTWLDDGRDVRKLTGALPSRAPCTEALAPLAKRLTGLLASFLERNHRARGEPAVRYLPFRDGIRTGVVAPWLAHQAWTKARHGMPALARQDLARLKPVRRRDGTWWLSSKGERSIAELSFAALAWCALGDKAKARRLATTLWACITDTGRLSTDFDGPGADDLQEYFPGQALLALAVCVSAGATKLDEAKATRALRYYRRFWRRLHPWGAYGWLSQAFGAWGVVLGREWLELACEIVDRGLPSQSVRGPFFTPDELEPPTALTGVYLEGVTAALLAARRLGDRVREQRYHRALERGLRYMDSLVYQPRDAAVLPNPAWAMGGVRSSSFVSEVRLDYVQHLLQCLATLRDGGVR